ncbi:MAG: hypothetical protein PHQ28_05710 [Mycobacterium sp.]|nr:hypothetical protein [Mycobacterium sp.]
MHAKKTGTAMRTVKVLGAVLVTLFAELAAGCAAEAPTTGTGTTMSPQSTAK